jgi:lipopolysaccharide export LptBFGC system permease protein LptF
MTIFDRYVARMFLSSYFILLFVGIGLYILSDVLVNLDEYTENADLGGWQVLAFMIDYYGFNLPLYYAQLGGPMLAIAAAFTLGNLLRNNELTALLAAGVPLQRLALPIFISVAFLLVLWSLNKELLIPPIANKIARTKDDISGQRAEGVYMVPDQNGILVTAQRLRSREGALERVQFILPGQDGRKQSLIDADRAIWDEDNRIWRLERGRQLDLMQTTDFEHPLRYTPVDSIAYKLPPGELVLQQRAEWSELLSLREMNTLAATPGLPNRASLIVNRHIRLTQPILHFILVALTIPFFLTREPSNVLVSGSRAVLVCGLFLGLTFLAHGIVREQGAALRAWAPILTFGPLAVVQLANVRT